MDTTVHDINDEKPSILNNVRAPSTEYQLPSDDNDFDAQKYEEAIELTPRSMMIIAPPEDDHQTSKKTKQEVKAEDWYQEC